MTLLTLIDVWETLIPCIMKKYSTLQITNFLSFVTNSKLTLIAIWFRGKNSSGFSKFSVHKDDFKSFIGIEIKLNPYLTMRLKAYPAGKVILFWPSFVNFIFYVIGLKIIASKDFFPLRIFNSNFSIANNKTYGYSLS